MKTLNFSTNLATSDAVAAVTESLNAIEPIDGWNIDHDDPRHLLTVQTTDNRITALVVQAVQRAGYQAVPIEE